MTIKPTHVSLDRPKAAPLEEGLPTGAVPYGVRSSWPLIVSALWQRRGVWHQLERVYTTPASPLHQARKWCDVLLPNDASEHVETAFRPLPDGRVQVFMRIRLEGQQPLLPPIDEDDEEDEGEEEVVAIEPQPGEPGYAEHVRQTLSEMADNHLEPEPEPEESAPEEPKPKPKGSKRGGPPLFSAKDIRDIRGRHKSGVRASQLAHEYGVTRRTINYIVRRKTYADIP